ncbi:D-alanyl-D-alanine carboxypeptidase family protein [Nostocaceae cyanobacterium CENA369]|uniref:D-alanyl-D-alanine carboxypeptidase family protein n=1 Tax=Dendronalium phyllosphericum CENA369 TaxID=1725256 RepID=A0A8J7I3E3_9NOST|nr:D-alanyl-D-alanine carboxypeptidase family protein [Dendronalium phyllosphericum]MBH8572750.1 D-alanyl-D-alanine carboxypeptidase family protein [Dendronalium phyllosphericum CENA369]
MNRASFSGQPQNLSGEPGDDIPVAVRDTPDVAPKIRLQLPILLLGGAAGFVLLAIISGFLFFVTAPEKTTNTQFSANNSAPAPITKDNNSSNTQGSKSDTVLGHLAYPEAPQSELVPISADGRIRMRKSAAAKFREMAQAARSAGVILAPISGFRSVKEQEQLFFSVGAQRNQTPAQRAALSAPPGHSEHHTGYAMDVGDGSVPATNLQANFDNTKAYKWLQANAARFGFEMSFPKNNVQGVSYEPWHWRYVGDRDSLEMFYKARNLKPIPTP